MGVAAATAGAAACTWCRWVTPESEEGGRGTLCDRRLGMSGIVVVLGGSSGRSASRLRSNFGV